MSVRVEQSRGRRESVKRTELLVNPDLHLAQRSFADEPGVREVVDPPLEDVGVEELLRGSPRESGGRKRRA